MLTNDFAIKGDFAYCLEDRTTKYSPDSYAVCINGKCAGLFKTLPQEFKNLPVKDYSGYMIIPGLVDLHLHASQFRLTGSRMDEQLLEWLQNNVFPEEGKFSDLDYAKKIYFDFTKDLKNSATTRASIFATIHPKSTISLMQALEDSGLKTFAGLVEMDRNSPDFLLQKDVKKAAADTRAWLEKSSIFKNCRPILTPRFVPSCTDELMGELSKIRDEYNLPVQSHLSENLGEIDWVKNLSPASKFYGQAYDSFGLFGGHGEGKCVMAHCVHSTEDEVDLMQKNGVFVAACPVSNVNLTSGIPPLRKYFDRKINMGFGSDIAAGSSLSIFEAMKTSVQTSKIRAMTCKDEKALSAEDAFYIATIGGGSFWGKVGSFIPGWDFDAVVIEKDSHSDCDPLKVRLEKAIYADAKAKAKFVCGAQIF